MHEQKTYPIAHDEVTSWECESFGERVWRGSSGGGGEERVRRRVSKACDQDVLEMRCGSWWLASV